MLKLISDIMLDLKIFVELNNEFQHILKRTYVVPSESTLNQLMLILSKQTFSRRDAHDETEVTASCQWV